MTFLKNAAALALLMALTSCGGSSSNSSKPVTPAGDTLASACPEVIDLVKQGADSIEKADKEKAFSDPVYLDKLESIVKRLDEIEAGIGTDEEAAPVQNLANGFAKILEEQSDDQAITLSTGRLFATAAQKLGSACIALTLRKN
jgi:hypothetical protein